MQNEKIQKSSQEIESYPYFKWPVICMQSPMQFQVNELSKFRCAELASKWLFAVVQSHMRLQNRYYEMIKQQLKW